MGGSAAVGTIASGAAAAIAGTVGAAIGNKFDKNSKKSSKGRKKYN